MVTNKCAAIVLFNKDRKMLLQHRTDDAPTKPNHWAFFGGCMEKGETPKQAVKRETFEELEYSLENPTLILTKNFGRGPRYYFIEEYNPKKELILHEGKDMGWFTLEETIGLKMSETDRIVLKEIEKKIR